MDHEVQMVKKAIQDRRDPQDHLVKEIQDLQVQLEKLDLRATQDH
jgi:hypothetical protein